MAGLPSSANPKLWGTQYNEFLEVEHNTDGTHGTITDLIAKGPSADVRAYGTVTIGTGSSASEMTANAAAIQAAIVSQSGLGGTVLFPAGTIEVNSMITGRSSVYLQGQGMLATKIKGIHTDDAVYSLNGRSRCGIFNMMLDTDTTTAPKCVLLLCRAAQSGGTAGLHSFINMYVRGYPTLAALYSLGSEENDFFHCTIFQQGTTAKYTYYVSENDDLSLLSGTGGGGSNLGNQHWGGSYYNHATDAAASTIYINAGTATGRYIFGQTYLVAKSNAFVTINSAAASGARGPFIFDNVEGEKSDAGDTVTYGHHYTTSSVTPAITHNITLRNSVLQTSDTNAVKADTNVTLDAFECNSDLNTQALSLYNVKNSTIYSEKADITIADRCQNNTITWDPLTKTLAIGSFAGANRFRTVIGIGYVPSFADVDATPAVNLHGENGVFLSGTATEEITDFDFGYQGQKITVISKAAITYSFAGNLTGSSVSVVTDAGDVTQWVNEDGTVWILTGYVDVSVDNSAGA